MSQITKALPPAIRPINMGHAVEQTGQSLTSRLFYGTLNTGKALVWDFPKWSFSNHPYVSGFVATVGAVFLAYKYTGGIDQFRSTAKNPAKKPADPKDQKIETPLEAAKKAIVAAEGGLNKSVIKSTELQPVLVKANEDLQKAQARFAELTDKLINEAQDKTRGIPDQRNELEARIKKNTEAKSKLDQQISDDASQAKNLSGAIGNLVKAIETDTKALAELDLKALNAAVRTLKREALDLEEQIENFNDIISKLTEKHKQAVEAEKKITK